MNKTVSKCDFCRYKTASGCTVTPNSYYCKDATNEFYAWLNSKKQTTQKRSR